MKIATAKQMASLDAAAINDIGIPGLVLMENAGRSTVEAVVERYGDPRGKPVAVFVGPGNNGGDGLVIARHLHQRGAEVRVFLLADEDRMKGDAAVNLAIVKNLALLLHRCATVEKLNSVKDEAAGCQLVIDALFGTGLQREVTDHFAAAVEFMNALPAPTVAVDLPSGLDADNGQVLGTAVRASLTVTFGLAKPGHFLYPGRDLCGALRVVEIGIPAGIVERAGLEGEALTAGVLQNTLPARPAAAHKGTFGHLLIAAGSIGKTGAAILSARAALHSGAGLVSLVVPKNLNPIFETSLPEAMTIPLSHSKDHLSDADQETIEAAIENKKAVVLGPGLGTDPQTAALIAALYREISLPTVVDADALNILAATPELLRAAGGPRVLTPHPGEMGRLCGLTVREIQSDRLNAARAFATEHDIFLVLKGADTVIAAPDGRFAINTSGNAGMATGGMGDVLSGLIGALLAQGMSPWQAACLAVHVHGLAADLLAEKKGYGYLAGEVAAMVPEALRLLTRPNVEVHGCSIQS